MKKIIALILWLTVCGRVQITMQEIYDAGQSEAMLKNHQSVYIQDESDGVPYYESYFTKDYVYCCYTESDWAEFITDDAYYDCFEGEYERAFPISPDGVRDIASFRAKYYDSPLFAPDTVYETIESVSKKNGRITVVSFFDQEALENKVDEDLTYGHYEYVLDAKSREVISCSGVIAYEGEESYRMDSKVSYDVEAPEMVKEFLKYANQTEDLRNITVISNPGTEKEVSQSFQAAKGLLVNFFYADVFYVDVIDADVFEADVFGAMYELYSDAACTELYDPYADTDSDLTIYVKWAE